jgi:hypothetical protein
MRYDEGEASSEYKEHHLRLDRSKRATCSSLAIAISLSSIDETSSWRLSLQMSGGTRFVQWRMDVSSMSLTREHLVGSKH